MKKIISVILSVLLLAALAAPVAADGSASMRLSASSTTLYRGDSFTVTVTLNNDQPVGRGGIVLSYDSGVFEFVGGSCNVSGATLAEVSAGRNGGVFALAEDRVVSGTIFTIEMRVKKGAAFGRYTISGTASMEISCSVSGTSVTVACKHSYGAYQKAGDKHSRVCSVCGFEDVSAHNWDSGKVTVSATCNSSGEKFFTCTDCGATKTETIAPNDNHRYGNWVYENEYTHWGTCSVCDETVFYNHSWEFKEVTRQATCNATGLQTLVCGTCDGEMTEEIPLSDHHYGEFESVDAQSHRHTCVDCGHEEIFEHNFTDRYVHDGHGHSQLCDDCGFAKAPEDHVPGAEATANTSQDCVVCGRMLKAALNHIHNYLTQWTTDESGHWYTCEYCEDRSQQEFHSFTSVCDDTCDTCGFVRIPTHDYSDILVSDATGHYYPCRGCGNKHAYASHIPGPAADIHTAQSCTACGYELAPRLPHDHVYTVEDGTHCHICACGEIMPAGKETDCRICAADPAKQLEHFPWWIVCIVEGVLLVVMAVLLLMRKPRKSKYLK